VCPERAQDVFYTYGEQQSRFSSLAERTKQSGAGGLWKVGPIGARDAGGCAL
jgi:hypothetical protein